MNAYLQQYLTDTFDDYLDKPYYESYLDGFENACELLLPLLHEALPHVQQLADEYEGKHSKDKITSELLKTLIKVLGE